MKISISIFQVIFIIFLALITNALYAQSDNHIAVREESLYFQYQKELLSKKNSPTINLYEDVSCPSEQEPCLSNLEIAIQALDELASQNKRTNKKKIIKEIYRLKEISQSIGEQLQLYDILTRVTNNADIKWENELFRVSQKSLQNNDLSAKDLYLLQATAAPAPVASPQALIDLIKIEPNLDKYRSGQYKNKPRIFMFCRSQRKFACLMIMKDSAGKLRTLADGKTPWSQPALGFSKYKKEYNQTNGNTPAGVLRIDGVMPSADKKNVFGKFRRLILNFVASSSSENDHLTLLPRSSHNETWWHQAVVARDIGRGLLRVHGTGLRSPSDTSYYPLVPTSGCIAKRENTYDKESYFDQRLLLDELMLASNLKPIYENEEKIRGLIYVVNINDRSGNVNLDDLYKNGILKK